MFKKIVEVIKKIIHGHGRGTIYYIGGSDVLPAPLPPEEEARMVALLGNPNGG